jgi:hypothetical protein
MKQRMTLEMNRMEKTGDLDSEFSGPARTFLDLQVHFCKLHVLLIGFIVTTYGDRQPVRVGTEYKTPYKTGFMYLFIREQIMMSTPFVSIKV